MKHCRVCPVPEEYFMKLVTGQFNDAFLPIMDGVTNVVKNYAEWMMREHNASYVVTPDFPDYTDKEPYPVIRYPSIPIPFHKPYRQGLPSLDAVFMKRIKEIPFDLVHTHTPFSAGHLALYVARKREIPLVASFHSKYYDDLYAALKVEAAARYGVRRIVEFYESADYVWTVNGGTADTLREYGYRGDIDVIRNGTDFVPPANPKALRRQVDIELGLRDVYPVFLYVGQLTWQKNLRVILEALALLKRQGMAFRMLMVGGGYAEEELKGLTENLDLSDNVVFLGTILDRERLKRIYCRADLFVFPSVYDNASIALREAAAVGCPALLVRGSNTAEGIVDDDNGFLAENDPVDIAERISRATADRKSMAETGLRAQKTIYTCWDEIMKEVNGRYAEIVKTGLRRNKLILKLVSPARLKGVLVQRQRKKLRLLQKKVIDIVDKIT
jgi:glycosyltransferase involved in cell wall biosynthesis